jgi:hypothetical protein
MSHNALHALPMESAMTHVEDGEVPDAWNIMERHVALTLAARDPVGFATAMRERRLMAWLQASIRASDDDAFEAVSPEGVQSLRRVWSALSDTHPPLVKWYDDWERAEALTQATLIRWACRTSSPHRSAFRKA